MARLHEYQGKTILSRAGIPVPAGGPVRTPDEARTLAAELGGSVVVKAQIWVTGRASRGLIQYADGPESTYSAAERILGVEVEGFTIETVLVEERLEVEREFYAGIIIDDSIPAPVLIFSSVGGTGIEEIAESHPDRIAQAVIDLKDGIPEYRARNLVRGLGISGKIQLRMANMLSKLAQLGRQYDTRAAEINPIILTPDGKLIAADCRITIDDYALYRQPDLDIEVAREYDRPPTPLEKIAWQVEKNDYRGTFYFIQMKTGFQKGDGVVGFHGAGGGGSMMSMDAILDRGYQLANFVDTSGNPPASKVYRAARIILAQGPIDGYFGSGSGVASQEQFHSARGLVKAFMEAPLRVPAVIRLGGNAEERAIAIMERARNAIPAPIEAYGKDDTPEFCAERLNELIRTSEPIAPDHPGFRPSAPVEAYTFHTVTGGTVTLDHALCRSCENKVCVETCVPQILGLSNDVPILNISPEEAEKGGCTECLACQIECFFEGNGGGFVNLPIPGLPDDIVELSDHGGIVKGKG